ncbi:hypothetical protein D3C71_1836400 [compost metagenome]
MTNEVSRGGLQLTGNQSGQHGFATAITTDDAGGALIQAQGEGVEQGLAVGKLIGEPVQDGQRRWMRDVSHGTSRKCRKDQHGSWPA